MMGEVLPTFSSNVLPSPTYSLTPRPLSLSETFRHTKPAARGQIPEDRCSYLKSRNFTLSCSPSTRTAASPGRNDNRRTILVLLSCDMTSEEAIIKHLVANRVHFFISFQAQLPTCMSKLNQMLHSVFLRSERQFLSQYKIIFRNSSFS